MWWLGLIAIVGCAYSPYAYLLDPPWVFITLPLWILWDVVFDERGKSE